MFDLLLYLLIVPNIYSVAHLFIHQIAAVGDLSLVTQELQRLEQQRGQRQSRKDTLRGAIQAEEQRVREVDIDLQSDKYDD